ncbi:MAG: hypothetical protein IID45_06300 [Planctomycetes bacterium]|nr:hypothetical protein [Planctomycetota bacterium]
MPTDHWNVLILGQSESAEMRSVVETVRRESARGACRETVSVDAALKLPGEHWFPDLVVVCQHFSDEFSRVDVRRLFVAFPLARWICCFGCWCESDGRTRDVWPLSVRVPARAATSRIGREFAVLRGAVDPLPLTGGRDEIFAFDDPGELPFSGRKETIAILSPDRPLRTWIRDLLASAGYETRTEMIPGSPPAVIVWDADPLTSDRWKQFESLRSRHPSCPVVALMNMACPQDEAELRAHGIQRVVAKLAPQTELLRTIQDALADPH